MARQGSVRESEVQSGQGRTGWDGGISLCLITTPGREMWQARIAQTRGKTNVETRIVKSDGIADDEVE